MRRTALSLVLVSMIVASILSYGPPVLGQAEAPKIGFFGSYKVTADKLDPSKLPIIGAWRMNFEKSDPSFNSYPPAVNNYKTVFTPEARSYWAKLDGKGIYMRIPRVRMARVRPPVCGLSIATRSSASDGSKARSTSGPCIGSLRMATRWAGRTSPRAGTALTWCGIESACHDAGWS